MTMLEPSYGGGAQTLGYGETTSESSKSAVSWPAVIAGAVVAAAVTLLLTELGAAIGLSSFSVWTRGSNPSPASFTAMAAIWLVVLQWLSAGFGGFLTGRMRTKWTDTHTDEVFFRDTANGLLAWALSTMLVVGFASSAITSVASGTARMAGGVVSSAAQGAAASDQRDGLIDTLLRPAMPTANASPQDARGEVGRILATGMTGTISPEDHSYLAQLVAARAGISEPDAEKRVDQVIAKQDEAVAKAKQAAEATRKATSAFLFYSFISMLIGAFIASAAAALGGRVRDDVAPYVVRA